MITTSREPLFLSEINVKISAIHTYVAVCFWLFPDTSQALEYYNSQGETIKVDV